MRTAPVPHTATSLALRRIRRRPANQPAAPAPASRIVEAILKLDEAQPGRLITYDDVLGQLTADGLTRTHKSVLTKLERESRDPDGVVVRVANGTYVRRTGPGPGAVGVEQRVLSAAQRLTDRAPRSSP
jgi:hypothetical protein